MRNWLFAFGILASLIGAARADDAILVLDASGSMWGQVDGKSKVEIARSVIGNLLTQIPADRRLGLVAYGHRRPADCADIEQIAPVGADRASIRKMVDALPAKGKTPLTAAVRYAAEQLHYKQGKATVILVSDGAESCNADPCALGAELEAAGVDFTVHVVGFGLPSKTEAAGLKCLAATTGGKYFTANNASELANALKQTVAAPAPTPAPKVATVLLRATDLAGGPEIVNGLAWSVKSAAGAQAFAKSNIGAVEVPLPTGQYVVSVQRASDGAKGEAKLDAAAGHQRTVTIPLESKLIASLVLTPPADAPVASAVSVNWTGPNRPGDYVTVVKKGATVTEYLDYKETKLGNPLEITLPSEAGDYEMRYVLGQPQRVLASVPLKAVATQASISAPPSAVAGSRIVIAWSGPSNSDDWITIVKPDVPATAYNDYFDAKPGNNQLWIPVEPGDYEFRYVLAGQKVIARTAVKVAPATAAIQAPTSVAANSTFDISWTGPNNHSDWLTIVESGAGPQQYGSYVDAEGKSTGQLSAPAAPGSYELRYVLNGKKVIATRPIQVGAH